MVHIHCSYKNAIVNRTPSHMLGGISHTKMPFGECFLMVCERKTHAALLLNAKDGRSPSYYRYNSLHRDKRTVEVAQRGDQIVFSEQLQRQLFLHLFPLPQGVEFALAKPFFFVTDDV